MAEINFRSVMLVVTMGCLLAFAGQEACWITRAKGGLQSSLEVNARSRLGGPLVATYGFFGVGQPIYLK